MTKVMKDIIVRKKYSVSNKHEELLHTNDRYEIYLFLRGDIKFCIDGRYYTLEPNDILLISSYVVHNVIVNSNKPNERIYIYFDNQYYRDFSDKKYDLLMAFNNELSGIKKNNKIEAGLVSKYGLDQKIQRMYELYQSDEANANVRMIAQMLDILVDVNQAYLEQRFLEGYENERASHNEKIDEVIRYITNNLDTKFTLDDLSRRFYISKYYLCHEFRRVTGMSCLEYIRQKKILEARILLQKGCPINEVWSLLGFEDYSSFYRCFKKLSGMSPTEYVEKETERGKEEDD